MILLSLHHFAGGGVSTKVESNLVNILFIYLANYETFKIA
jgi:hypothetical protein